MVVYSTPTKASQSMEKPHSCLKHQYQQSMDKSPFQIGHKTSQSQVRFSLPVKESDSEDTESRYEEDEYNQNVDGQYYSEREKCRNSKDMLQAHYLGNERNSLSDTYQSGSPNKIVYPTSVSSKEELPTFVDYSNKVNVPVPKELWECHVVQQSQNSKELFGGHNVTPNGSPRRPHSRTNSLQSIIVETIETYKPKQHTGNVLNLQDKPILFPDNDMQSELYIRPDSPMNKYEVPIPLQIHLPPYLSPTNEHKKRNSLVFDGEGYSVYLGDNSTNNSDVSLKDIISDEDDEITDISIPSAENNLSFTIDGNDVDRKLGIDSDANVDLKKQVRNLRKYDIQGSKKSIRKDKPLPSIVVSEQEDTKIRDKATPKKILENNIILDTPVQKHGRTDINEIHPEVIEKENVSTSVSKKVRESSHNISSNKTSALNGREINDVSKIALEILATPTKEITIPEIDDIPRSSTKNGTLAFFDRLPDSNIYEESNNTKNHGSNELNTHFKFPSVGSIKMDDSDFVKTNERLDSNIDKRREKLRQRVNIKGHTHTRSRSIHTDIDMTEIMNSVHEPSLRATNISSPHIPKRSPLRPPSQLSLRESNFHKNETHMLQAAHNLSSDAAGRSNKYVEAVHNTSSDYSDNDNFSFANSSEIVPQTDVMEGPNDKENSTSSNSTQHKKDLAILNDTKTQTPFVHKESILNPNEILKSQVEICEPKPLSTIYSFANSDNDLLKIPTSLISDSNGVINRKGSLLDPATKLSNPIKTSSQSSYESELSKYSYPSVSTALTDPIAIEIQSKPLYDNRQLYENPNKLTQNSLRPTDNFNCSPGERRRNLSDPNISEKDIQKEFTIVEEHDGKMVEVIVLDDDVPTQNISKELYSKKAISKRKSLEIVDLCEKTAEDLKDLIYELTTEEQKKNIIPNLKSLPPLPSQFLREHKVAHQKEMNLEKQKRYMERLQGIRR